MISQFLTSNDIALPSISTAVKLPGATVFRRRRLNNQQKHSIISTISMGTALILLVLVAHAPTSSPRNKSTSTAVSTSVARLLHANPLAATHPSASKPSRPSAPALTAPGCTNKPAASDGSVFAQCASLSFDFENSPNGLIDTRSFNIYTGAPEANNEAQLYTSSQQNLRVENGSLLLRALNQSQQGYKYTSARIDTKNKEDFLYGKLVIRATLPDSIGAWPAIWMLPTDKKYEKLSSPYNLDRYLNDGEIDIAESVGTQPHVVYGIAHSLAYPPDSSRGYFNTITVPDNNTAYHDYGVNWTPTNLTFTVDGTPYFSIDKQIGADYHSWPYDQRYHLVLNLALGGTWGGTDRTNFPVDGVDTSALPATMSVKYIHYYPYTGPR